MKLKSATALFFAVSICMTSLAGIASAAVDLSTVSAFMLDDNAVEETIFNPNSTIPSVQIFNTDFKNG